MQDTQENIDISIRVAARFSKCAAVSSYISILFTPYKSNDRRHLLSIFYLFLFYCSNLRSDIWNYLVARLF